MAAAPEPAHTAGMEERHETKVFIAEDSAEVRRYIFDLIEDVEGARVVGEAESAEAAVAGIIRTEPDCVVLDFQLAGGTALDVLRAVHPRAPQITFIVLTNFANPQYRRACIAAGATCFFDKSSEFLRVRDVIAGLEPLPN
jgi:DNA-binding NarL/FixJ family response regulator